MTYNEESQALQEEEKISLLMDTAQDTQKIQYKVLSQIQEVDWTVTLARRDFPWFEIAFGSYTPKECYEKFR